MKYSTFPKAPRLEPSHQMQFSAIPRILIWRGSLFLSLQRYSRCILQPEPTGRHNHKGVVIKRTEDGKWHWIPTKPFVQIQGWFITEILIPSFLFKMKVYHTILVDLKSLYSYTDMKHTKYLVRFQSSYFSKALADFSLVLY